MPAAHAELSRKAEIHRMLADIYDRQAKNHEALSEYNALVQLAPGDAEAHAAYGRFLYRTNQPGLAAAQFKKATSLDGSKPEYWGGLGNSLLTNKDYKGAIDALRRGGPACQKQLQDALNYQQQVEQVNKYNDAVKKQQQQQQKDQ
jgi:Tfp pilus assembly protein PilF